MGLFCTRDLNLEIYVILPAVDASPQLYFTHKNTSIAPKVAEINAAKKPTHKPKSNPPIIFRKGFIGTERKQLPHIPIYINNFIRV